jgi:hypothetical protein
MASIVSRKTFPPALIDPNILDSANANLASLGVDISYENFDWMR